MIYNLDRDPEFYGNLFRGASVATKKILVVDDQGELRKLVRMTLEFGDYELHEVEDGERALELIDKVRPDVVILDIMMPGDIDGIQVCESIKSDEKTSSTFVILLSARGQKSDIEKGEKAGADAYLVKPFSPLELIEIVGKGVS